MNLNGDAIDRFFLAHAEERARQTFLLAGISVKNLAEEFEKLAEREPIPNNLRDHYRQVAQVLAELKAAMGKAEGQMFRILNEAAEGLPEPATTLEADQALREAVNSTGMALNIAENLAWELLRKAGPQLKGGRWDEDKVHTRAKVCLQLDPGPDFQQYWLEDTDFNLLEVPFAALDLWDEEECLQEEWTFESGSRMGPAAALTPHGRWLHNVLSHSFVGWEQLPLVRTIFVDFDLGTGMSVPDATQTPP